MARPKKWASEADRVAAYRSKRTESVQTDDPIRTETPIRTQSVHSQLVAFVDQTHVPRDPMAPPWSGSGRGMPREHNGKLFVLVARGSTDPVRPEHGVVTLADWHARLGQRCQHGLRGWACHCC